MPTDCHDLCALQSQLISGESLPKTGIFATVAGDFYRNWLGVLDFGSSETSTELQKRANSGPFCSVLSDSTNLGTAWLATQWDANHSPA